MTVKRGLRAKDVVRCAACGRLIERKNARPGPDGVIYGGICYDRAVRKAKR